MKSYYTIEAPIRYYPALPVEAHIEGDSIVGELAMFEVVDPADWPEPMHERIANMPIDAQSVLAFTWRYGVITNHPIRNDRFRVDIGDFEGEQHLLRRAWAGDKNAIAEMELHVNIEGRLTPSGIGLEVSDPLSLAYILLVRDHLEGKTKVCANPDCAERPYFLQTRKGQKYCRHECAVLVNVRRFRERARKRKRAKKVRRR